MMVTQKRLQNKQVKGEKKKEVHFISLFITLAAGVIIWLIGAPAGLDEKAWHLFAIFVATIIGLIIKPLPMGGIAILSITAVVLTGTLELQQALSGFQNTTIWLIVIAFFISRGFIKTGLGNRIAYMFVKRFGKLGLLRMIKLDGFQFRKNPRCFSPSHQSGIRII